MIKIKTNTIQAKNKISHNAPYIASHSLSAGSFAARCALSAAVCFIASFGTMVGFPSYVSVACAVMAGRYSGAALLGALASYAVQGRMLSSAVQLGAIVITVAVNVFFPYVFKNGDPIRLSLFTAAVNLLLSCIISTASPDSFSVSMRMLSSLISACLVYAAAFVSQRASSGEPVRIRGLTAVYCAMLYIAAIATLSSLQIGIFNIGRIIACAAIPEAAKKRRSAGGAVMGALAAVSVTMCSSSLSANTMLLAAAGLVCSAFCDFGRLATAIAFMLSASATLATTGLNADTFNMLADIIAGTAVFTAMPPHLLSRLTPRFMIMNSPSDSAGQTASSRLTFAAMTVADIREKLALVSEAVENRAVSLSLADRVAGEACLHCRLYDDCRKKGLDRTIAHICENAEKGLPCGEISEACVYAEILPQIVSRCREEQLSDRAEAIRMKEMRLFLREQLGSMSDVLNDLSCRLSRKREIDTQLSSSAKGYFERQGFDGVRACVYTDENCCRHAEIYLTGNPRDKALSLTAGLCRVLECDFELPGITCANSITKLEFDEIPPFKADIGSYAALGTDGVCSGDTLEDVECSAGERYLLLSDGMGSGKRARLDSALSVNLAEHMLRSGLSMTTSQRIINSVMRVKDWEESFAALDFLRLDLFEGRAEFLKSGAAPAYLCRDGNLVKIDCDSYPAGILPSCEPNISSCKLFDGDVLILATDGADEQSVRQAAKLIDDRPEASAKQLALGMGSLCSAAHQTGNRDDITLAVVKISRQNVNVCV